MTLDLTIAIPVKNEELNLSGCLKAIGTDLARHIVVIDSESTDKTKEIAAFHGAEVVDFKWNGKFPKKRNWFLRSYEFKTKWVLFLDADEYLTNDFKTELREKLRCGNGPVGYWLNYTIYFLGKKLKAGYPLKKLALFQIGAGEYEKVEEQMWSQMDMEVHEHPILDGKVGFIRSKIDHRDFRGVSHYMMKHNEYAAWEGSRLLQAANRKEVSRHWTWKQKIKYRLISTPFLGPVYFLGSFIGFGGWKDGSRGFVFALLKMSYFTQIYCKIQENRR